jgi:hypothetical protein
MSRTALSPLGSILCADLKLGEEPNIFGSALNTPFGKFKHMERDQAKAGFTGLVLGLAAMVSTTTTAEVVQQELATVTTQKVRTWCKQTLGVSV